MRILCIFNELLPIGKNPTHFMVTAFERMDSPLPRKAANPLPDYIKSQIQLTPQKQ